jgi:hypothetical protein
MLTRLRLEALRENQLTGTLLLQGQLPIDKALWAYALFTGNRLSNVA